MNKLANPPKYILTDIEGTTSSVSFVYDVLFPFFRNNLVTLKNEQDNPQVQAAVVATTETVFAETGQTLNDFDAVLKIWDEWCQADRKITPLKTMQGLVWKAGFESGELKGHVYEEVPALMNEWHQKGMQIGIFSSGSIAAQQLLFSHTEAGDLSLLLSDYFDTTTGPKREMSTYAQIVEKLKLPANEILFLSDVREELLAADQVGMMTIQLVREGTISAWERTANDFQEVNDLLQ
ncbi:MAG: acireductone synthase [Bacteroidota bacterium]|jgi:enolase-phosphatase E1